MQRTGISANNAKGISQKSHQRAEVVIIEERTGSAARIANCCRKLFFSRAIVDDAAQPQDLAYLFAKRAKSLRGPALGAPASSGTKSNVAFDAVNLQIAAPCRCIGWRNVERETGATALCVRAQRKLTVLVGDVYLRASNAIGIEHGNAVLANCFWREADPARNSCEQWECRRFPQTLIVNRDAEFLFANAAQDCPNRGQQARLSGPDLRGQSATFDKKFPARMGQPDNLCIWQRFAQGGDGGKRMHNIAKRAQADDQKFRIRHAAPCGWIREDRVLNDPLGRQQWRRECQAARRQRAPARSLPCNPCLWHERRAATLRGVLRRWVRRRARRSLRCGGPPRAARARFHREPAGRVPSSRRRWNRRSRQRPEYRLRGERLRDNEYARREAYRSSRSPKRRAGHGACVPRVFG